MGKEINSFRAYFKKEYIEGIRSYKFLILALGVIFFAFLDPIMLKMMPVILKSQLGSMDLSSMIQLNQTSAIANFCKDLFQISTFITVLTLMGLISGERNDKTLTIPVSMGCSLNAVLLSKLIIYGVYLTILSVTGMSIAFYYSGIIFGFDDISFVAILRAGFLYGMFYFFVLSLLMLISSLVKKPFIAGIISLLIVFLIPALQNFKWLKIYLPSNLTSEALSFSIVNYENLAVTLMTTAAVIIVLNILSAIKLKKTEFV
jgi:ABC-2 type transport system permease protein